MRWFGLACAAMVLWGSISVSASPAHSSPKASTQKVKQEHVQQRVAKPAPKTQMEMMLEPPDRIEEKNPVFDPDRIDRRLLDGWEVNQSAAVIQLEGPKDLNPESPSLYPSYAALLAKNGDKSFLPSLNLINGAAKQIDDGVYAALDLACFRGELNKKMPGAVDFIAAVFENLPKRSPSRPLLASALKFAGRDVQLTKKELEIQTRIMAGFESSPMHSKPIGFYTWSPELQQVWKFFRILQKECCEPEDLRQIRDVAKVLKKNKTLNDDYAALLAFYAHLTNPGICLPVTALSQPKELNELAAAASVTHAAVAIFPSSTNAEAEYLESRLIENQPPEINRIDVIIKAICDGDIRLKPNPGDGWYQYQTYALECLLMPGKNPESEHLLLWGEYKKRLVDIFKTILTKTRETHARQLYCAKRGGFDYTDKRPSPIVPRLRVEPCPELYLRTARAYAFLENFLKATLSPESFNSLHGLKADGERPLTLRQELESIRLRYYGLYLIACDDIGMAPQFLKGEPVVENTAFDTAQEWLNQISEDPDLACDTRVAIPIEVNPDTNTARLLVTVGVGMQRISTRYARPPMIRPHKEGEPWQEVTKYELTDRPYNVLTDEFLEVEMSANKIPNREELRALCDRCTTKEEIQQALEALK